ncbi:MAG: 50S ribosomal protein L24, partial [Endomicrobium sp.]|nr:50S ribosomal protein L24 [Endomicrobium sp.]
MIGVKKEDKVLILSGRDKGKKSKIIAVFPDKRMVTVENVNVVKKHMKKTQKTSGGIYEKESLINISKVMLVCR